MHRHEGRARLVPCRGDGDACGLHRSVSDAGRARPTSPACRRCSRACPPPRACAPARRPPPSLFLKNRSPSPDSSGSAPSVRCFTVTLQSRSPTTLDFSFSSDGLTPSRCRVVGPLRRLIRHGVAEGVYLPQVRPRPVAGEREHVQQVVVRQNQRPASASRRRRRPRRWRRRTSPSRRNGAASAPDPPRVGSRPSTITVAWLLAELDQLGSTPA